MECRAFSRPGCVGHKSMHRQRAEKVSLLSPMPARRTTYDAAVGEVREFIGSQIYKEMERYLLAREPAWWGEHAGVNMGKLMLLGTAMHDGRLYSYNAIYRTLQPKLVIWPSALQHNCRLVRRIMAQWGEETCQLPTRRERDEAVAGRNFPKWMEMVRFWIDSTDIPLARTRRVTSRKGIHYSGKLARPAWRYMVLRDGTGKISEKAWGGYSPKTYDAEFMRTHRQWFEENLRGTAILADTHFFSARDYIKNPEILATPPKNAGVDLLRARGLATTTKEAKNRSKKIKETRGVVE